MDLPKIRSVVSDPAQPDGDRLVLLRMSEKGMDSYTIPWHKVTESTCKPADIPVEAQEFLSKEAKGLVEYNFDLDYDYWTAGACVLQCISQLYLRVYLEECLHSFLPEELRDGAPTGFAMTGHIGPLFPCRTYWI